MEQIRKGDLAEDSIGTEHLETYTDSVTYQTKCKSPITTSMNHKGYIHQMQLNLLCKLSVYDSMYIYASTILLLTLGRPLTLTHMAVVNNVRSIDQRDW